MSDGIAIAVQIRAPDPTTNEDVPTYYTSEHDISESSLNQFDAPRMVEDVMQNAVREVVAEWSEEHTDE